MCINMYVNVYLFIIIVIIIINIHDILLWLQILVSFFKPHTYMYILKFLEMKALKFYYCITGRC